MRLAMLILMVLLSNPAAVLAQATDTATTRTPATHSTTTSTTTVVPTTTVAPTTTTVPSPAQSGESTRDQLTGLLSQNPRELPTVLAIEPSLIANDQFLAAHPELASFVAAHPEVKLQPSFYLGGVAHYARAQRNLGSIFEPLMAFSAFAAALYALTWIVRTMIDQRRWTRLAQTQSDVHNKILDRFGSSAELLDYVKTSAGSRFLESAPIQLSAEPAVQHPALARVIGSIQVGLILAAGAIGALIVGARYTDETGQGLFALGVIGLCLGGGFILSAIVSIFVARRFAAAADAGPVR